MKKIILLLFTTTLLFSQQTNTNQGIELPEFVITGVQAVNMPVLKKERPEYVSTLSEQFFSPNFSPEEVKLEEFSKPPVMDVEIFHTHKEYSGVASLSVSQYSLPNVKAHIGGVFGKLYGALDLWGVNGLEYDDNTGYYNIGGKITNEYNLQKDDYFSESKLSVIGYYNNKGYKLFGSSFPELNRNHQVFDLKTGIENFKTKHLDYKLFADYSYHRLRDQDGIKYYEHNIAGDFYADYKLGTVGFTLESNPEFISYYNGSESKSNFFYSGEANIMVAASVKYSIEFGLYTSYFDEFVIGPSLKMMYKPVEYLGIMAGYGTRDDVKTRADLIQENPFISLNINDEYYEKRSSVIDLLVDYEYSRYFEVSVGATFGNYDTTSYFIQDNANRFTLVETNDVNRTELFVDAQFHLGPGGMLYATVKYDGYTKDGEQLPFVPAFYGSADYSYQLNDEIVLSPGIYFADGVNTDLTGENSLDMILDLSMKASYKYSGELEASVEINNLLNNDNYKYSGYKLKPMDLAGTITFRL